MLPPTSLVSLFRSKLIRYEKEHGGAIAKLRVTENKQNRLESEIEVTQKRAKELHRQNRSLQDEQRELELDIKVSVDAQLEHFIYFLGNATRTRSNRRTTRTKRNIGTSNCKVSIYSL